MNTKITEKLESEIVEALGDVARRKEYREALARAGISMDWLVENLRNIAMAGEKDSDRIKALQVLLKSVGVDKVEKKNEEEGGGWEDELLKVSDDNDEVETGDYEVKEPPMPEAARKKRDEDNKLTKSIYE